MRSIFRKWLLSLPYPLQRSLFSVWRGWSKIYAEIRRPFRSARIYFASTMLSTAAQVKPFLVVTTARSGSSLLGDLLSQHPRLEWGAEKFRLKSWSHFHALEGLRALSQAPVFGVKFFTGQLSSGNFES